MISRLKIWFSNLVFALKRRAGFRQFGLVSVTGTVTSVEVSSDGDTCFNLLPGYDREELLQYRTSGAVHTGWTLHCEIVPADRERLAGQIAKLKPGVRATVLGVRSWDGCHHGRGVLFDALMVLLRAAPVVDGWIEIHPVEDLEVL